MRGGEYIEYLQELLGGLGSVQARRMFGGHGLYHEGLMIGLVAQDRLYLKTDAESQARFREAGSEPFVYRGGGRTVEMSYWSAPEEALDAAHAMLPWARLAYAAAVRAAAAKAARPARRRRSGQT